VLLGVKKNIRAIFVILTIWAVPLITSASEIQNLKNDLFRKYGISAVDKTDQHSPQILKNLLFLLDNAYSLPTMKRLESFRWLYAYQGHDQRYNLAGYHRDAKAISIGGQHTYSEANAENEIAILATLAHEIGHAFIMDVLTPAELEQVSKTYGGWERVYAGTTVSDFFSPSFFMRHPLKETLPAKVEAANSHEKALSLTSGYAVLGVHEWFADAFAAAALNHLGKKDLLGKNWQQKLVSVSKHPSDYWTNYNNVSDAFVGWLQTRLN